MDIKEIKAEINLKEMNILGYALQDKLINTIKNHYSKLQNTSNSYKRNVFFEQEKQELNLLMSMDIDGHNRYKTVINTLDREINIQAKDDNI